MGWIVRGWGKKGGSEGCGQWKGCGRAVGRMGTVRGWGGAVRRVATVGGIMPLEGMFINISRPGGDSLQRPSPTKISSDTHMIHISVLLSFIMWGGRRGSTWPPTKISSDKHMIHICLIVFYNVGGGGEGVHGPSF